MNRIVPALTRCTHGLIIMWEPDAYNVLPWGGFSIHDGLSGVFEALDKIPFDPDVERVTRWFTDEKTRLLFQSCSSGVTESESRIVAVNTFQERYRTMEENLTDEQEPISSSLPAILDGEVVGDDGKSADDGKTVHDEKTVEDPRVQERYAYPARLLALLLLK